MLFNLLTEYHKEMKIEGTILVYDNNKGLMTALVLLLQKEFENVITEADADKIIQVVEKNNICILILDSGQNGHFGDRSIPDFVRILKEKDPFLQVLLLTNFSQNRLGLEAVEAGAFDFVSKPWNNEKLIVTLRNAYKMRQQLVALKQINAVKESFKNENQFFWGISEASKGIFEAARKYSQSNDPLLICGKKGSGKELLAQQIHSLGPRRDFAFIRMDALELQEADFERNLAMADGGTAYIENFEALDNTKQEIVLETLKNKTFNGLNNVTSIKANIRIIAGSSKGASELKGCREMNETVLTRLIKNCLRMPSLNERKEDIIPLATVFLNKYCKKHGKRLSGFSELAKEILEENGWTGNTSELSLTIERAVIIAPEGGQILPGHIMLSGESPEIARNSINTLTLEQMEGKMMRAALKRNNGNITLAAEQLGITRQTMYNKGKKHKLFK